MSQFFQNNNPKRQKLIATEKPGFLKSAKNGSLIKTLKDLKAHLQTAIELEHSTIPPYLCALYSIKDGFNQTASMIIRSVVVEEMLHMIMAANILNAIGGKPSIDAEKFIPNYPTALPNSDNSFIVNLEKFSKSSIETFLKIEKPAPTNAPPEDHHYHSIGQFYAALREGLIYLDETTKGGIFIGDKDRQITSEHYYGSGGKLVAVHNLEDALLAIDEIVGQGEGIDGTIQDPNHLLFGEDIEYAHYFKFNEIYYERYYRVEDSPQKPPSGNDLDVDWSAVHNMKLNPKMADYKKDSEVYSKTYEFNKTYVALLENIHNACDGNPDLLNKGMALMYDLKYKAIELMNVPVGDGKVAGPSFEYVK